MKRPLLDQLYDLEHHFKLDGMTALSADVREAIDELTRLRALTEAVDVKVGEPLKTV